jgi:signal transduction histidine kinase
VGVVSVSHAQRVKNIGAWLIGYSVFIIFAIVISYYLNSLPPGESELSTGFFIESDAVLLAELSLDNPIPVSLPDMSTADRLGVTEGWYVIPVPFNRSSFTDDKLAVYLPTVGQNAEVFLNDRWLGNGGRMQPPVDRNFNSPLLLNFDKKNLSDENNTIYLRLKGALPLWTYLGKVYIGTEAALRPVQKKQQLLRVNVIIFTSIALVFTSIFTATLWFLRRGVRESYYLWYACAEVLWAAHDTNLFLKQVPFPDSVWESLVPLTIGWSILSFTCFFHRYIGGYNKNIDRLILVAGIGLSLPFIYQELAWVAFYGYKIWLVFVLLVGLYGGGFVLKNYIKTRDHNVLLMIFAALVMIAFGIHDWLAVIGILPPSSPFIMYISAILIIMVISSLLIRRFVESLNVVEHYNEELRAEVLKKEQQLRLEHQKTQKLQKQQVLNDERERIMRDIHDGIGGQLVGTLAAIDSPDITIQQVKGNLQMALQDLRMVIDSLDGDAQDISTILGTLRMRLGGLLRQANIKLIWDVHDLPQQEEFGPEKALSMMRIVQEAITNVIKHSGATELTVSAYPEVRDGREVTVVSVRDNGCGMAGDGVRGRGLYNMEARAKRMGALFEISPGKSQGTLMKLIF